MRTAILAIVPEATEKISYGIPTFYLNGNLVHFAAFKRHIGFTRRGRHRDVCEEFGAYKFRRARYSFRSISHCR
ncbi:MAG: hypothetical protein R2912_02600 [Eubacteriales bacterium]